MNVPILEGGAIGHASPPASLDRELLAACAEHGCFYLTDPLEGSPLARRVLDAARTFFALPLDQKQAVGIARSAHYRGYSAMKGPRDQREQVHLGRESAALSKSAPAFRRLEGPNLWPSRLGRAWRDLMLAYLDEVNRIGRAVLAILARALHLPQSGFAPAGCDRPYLLMKLLHYGPHAGSHTEEGEAMGAHCDFSFITILAQDGAGLAARTPLGRWLDLPAIDDTVLVTVGELTEIVTGGVLTATPHRVAGVSAAGRLSVPVFINPDLRQTVRASRRPGGRERASAAAALAAVQRGDHVHRVREPGRPPAPLVFGEAEWTRKGNGRWCYQNACLGSSRAPVVVTSAAKGPS